MILNLVLFIIFLFVLLKSAGYSIKWATQLSSSLRIPEFIVSFFIIALISTIPEATISIVSAISGNPEFGFGTLLGANVANLTLVFGIIALFSFDGIKVESKILKNNFSYLILLLAPLILGIDGKFSRIDGAILVLLGLLFFFKIYEDSKSFSKKFDNNKRKPFNKTLLMLIISLIFLLVSAYLTVKYATNFAYDINLSPVLIGLTIIAIGTCLPELIFSLKAIKQNKDDLATGDILGTVITDTTIVLGLVALISPFSYPIRNVLITAGASFLAGIFITIFMKTNRAVTKIEGIILILIYVIFIFVEFFINSFFNF